VAIKTPKVVLYHIPKCGGIYAKEALRRGLYHPEMDYGRCRHAGVTNPFGLYREHSVPDNTYYEDKQGRLSICFVRHPITWYRSYWCFRVKTESYDPKFPIDHREHDNYEDFVDSVLNEHPDGFVSKLYQQYTGKDLSKIDFIGKQERLTEDLVYALKLAGQKFDEKRLRRTKWVNCAARSPIYRSQAVISEDTKNRILETEEWVMNTFYHGNV
jgi:hypothetical protein